MPTYPDLTPEIARRALCQAGFSYAAEALTIDAREERWVVSLPDGRIAWFPASPAGARRLAVERRVLGVLAARCSFRAPEVLFVSNSGFDLRRMVRGRCDPWGLYRRCQAERELAQKIGHSIGQILAEQHTQIVETDAAGWLPQQVPWPEAERHRRAVARDARVRVARRLSLTRFLGERGRRKRRMTYSHPSTAVYQRLRHTDLKEAKPLL